MQKFAKLKQMLHSDELEFIMEAHNGLSAKIVEEAGFKGIWASGLSISAALGVRDNNEASWTQVLEVLEFMSDHSSIPILLDGDTGYGNFNNMRRLVKKLEQREIAGVCIEDKLFPKTNSFIDGGAQPLADMDEFCGKIKAAKDAQKNDDFVVVARTEAFIAGWSVDEALRRAEAYRKAGADAILVHSKKASSVDIESFMKEWGDRYPVVIVPTKYYSTPTDKFRILGVSMVIWANHTLRSSVLSMKETVQKIYEDQSLVDVEDNIVSVAEVFRLQGAHELQEAEKKYLPINQNKVNAIVLAAGQGKELGELTEKEPKTLLKVKGKSILDTQVADFNQLGIKKISVVLGFGRDYVKTDGIKVVENKDHDETKELYSLFLAKDHLKNTVISYGDVIFKSSILHELLNDNNPITIIADTNCDKDSENIDFIQTEFFENKKLYFEPLELKKMSINLDKKDITGEFIGVWKVNADGAKIVCDALENLSKRADFKELVLADLFSEILKKHKIHVKYVHGSWIDVNTIVDLQKAGEL